jgi:hypothetical protein
MSGAAWVVTLGPPRSGSYGDHHGLAQGGGGLLPAAVNLSFPSSLQRRRHSPILKTEPE